MNSAIFEKIETNIDLMPPIYKHRAFSGAENDFSDFSALNLIDSVTASANRAIAVLEQMSMQYNIKGTQLSDNINLTTIESVKREMLDIISITQWFQAKSKNTYLIDSVTASANRANTVLEQKMARQYDLDGAPLPDKINLTTIKSVKGEMIEMISIAQSVSHQN